MQTSIQKTVKNPSQDLENFLTNSVMAPLGSIILLPFGISEKVEENTFEIVNEQSKSITVCGDTIINLFLGKTNLSTLKFQ